MIINWAFFVRSYTKMEWTKIVTVENTARKDKIMTSSLSLIKSDLIALLKSEVAHVLYLLWNLYTWESGVKVA